MSWRALTQVPQLVDEMRAVVTTTWAPEKKFHVHVPDRYHESDDETLEVPRKP